MYRRVAFKSIIPPVFNTPFRPGIVGHLKRWYGCPNAALYRTFNVMAPLRAQHLPTHDRARLTELCLLYDQHDEALELHFTIHCQFDIEGSGGEGNVESTQSPNESSSQRPPSQEHASDSQPPPTSSSYMKKHSSNPQSSQDEFHRSYTLPTDDILLYLAAVQTSSPRKRRRLSSNPSLPAANDHDLVEKPALPSSNYHTSPDQRPHAPPALTPMENSTPPRKRRRHSNLYASPALVPPRDAIPSLDPEAESQSPGSSPSTTRAARWVYGPQSTSAMAADFALEVKGRMAEKLEVGREKGEGGVKEEGEGEGMKRERVL